MYVMYNDGETTQELCKCATLEPLTTQVDVEQNIGTLHAYRAEVRTAKIFMLKQHPSLLHCERRLSALAQSKRYKI